MRPAGSWGRMPDSRGRTHGRQGATVRPPGEKRHPGAPARGTPWAAGARRPRDPRATAPSRTGPVCARAPPRRLRSLASRASFLESPARALTSSLSERAHRQARPRGAFSVLRKLPLLPGRRARLPTGEWGTDTREEADFTRGQLASSACEETPAGQLASEGKGRGGRRGRGRHPGQEPPPRAWRPPGSTEGPHTHTCAREPRARHRLCKGGTVCSGNTERSVGAGRFERPGNPTEPFRRLCCRAAPGPLGGAVVIRTGDAQTPRLTQKAFELESCLQAPGSSHHLCCQLELPVLRL